jgi:hypothetical protein
MLNLPSGHKLLQVTALNEVILNNTLFSLQFIQKPSCYEGGTLEGRKHFRLRLIILRFISFRPRTAQSLWITALNPHPKFQCLACQVLSS